MTPHFAARKIGGRQARHLKQPTGKSFGMTQLRRLFCQNNKDRLRDFLGVMRIADVPQRDGIHQVDVPRHQRGERLVRMVFRIVPQQHAVIRWLHFPISVRPPAKTDNLFAGGNH